MTRDFIPRRAGAQAIGSCLGRDAGGPLMVQYALAARAGRAVAPVLKQFRLAIDYSDPAYCRVEGETLVLLAENAVQQNRIRQLTQRLAAALAAHGLPLTSVDVRIIARTQPPSQPETPSPAPRPKTAVGAAAVGAMLPDIENERLRATLERLRTALSPDRADLRETLERRFCEESVALVEERHQLALHASDLDYGIGAARIPSEEEARDYPRLEAERARKLKQLSGQQDELRTVRHRLDVIDRRLAALERALELLPSDPAAAEAAALDFEEPAEPVPTEEEPRTTAAGAATVLALAARTRNLRLRKSLEQLGRVMNPATQTAIRALTADIDREERRLRDNETELRGPEKEKRLGELLEARRTLREDPAAVRAVAARLYGRE